MHWYFLQEMHFLVIILCTKLLRLIQVEPLYLKTSFKLWRVGLVKDTYVFFIFLNFILFKMLKKNEYKFSH